MVVAMLQLLLFFLKVTFPEKPKQLSDSSWTSYQSKGLGVCVMIVVLLLICR